MQLDLTIMPIPSAIRRIAVPASVGFFFLTMFNVVDTFFAGQLSTNAVAALSRAFPVFFIILSAGNGLSTGATACIGGALGAKDHAKASGYAMQALLMGAAAGLLLTVLGLLLSPWLFGVLGAKNEDLALCLEYMDIIFYGAIFFLLMFMSNSVLQAMGDTTRYRNFLVVSFFLNCILDPWLIGGGLGVPALGLEGIAWATVICNAWGAYYLGRGVWKSGIFHGIKLQSFRIQWPLFGDIMRQGLPSTFNFMTIGLGIFVITYYLSQYGDVAVAAYGIATRIEQIVLLPTIGLNIAVLALVAQNYGAGEHARVFQSLRTALIQGAWLMGSGGVLLFLGAEWLMSIFSEDAAVVETGAVYLRIASIVLYAYVILFTHVAALQGVRKPMFGVWVGVLRQIIFPITVFHTGVFLLDSSVLWIWWSILGITWIAAILSIILGRKLLQRTLDAGKKPI